MTRFISVDPSSTVVGWAVFQDDGLVAWGKINATGAPYGDRFGFIIEELAAAAHKYGARALVTEDVKYAWAGGGARARNIAGLQVAFKAIRDFAKQVGFDFKAYNPATWKASVLNGSHASKEATRENICFRFPRLPRKLSEHEYDAIGIGIYHAGTLKFESMAVGVPATCVACGRPIPGTVKGGRSICQDCAGKAADGASPNDRLALAKTGLDALIDEATGFQDVRPKNDLAGRFRNYRGKKK